MKKIVTCLILLTFITLAGQETFAHEETLTYSLEEGGTQTIEFESSENETLQIQVQEMPQVLTLRSTILVPNRGIYKVTASLTNQWHASYYVSISSSFEITNTSGFSLNVLTGSLKSSKLSHTNNQAIASFERKVGLVTKSNMVKATLKGKSLIIN